MHYRQIKDAIEVGFVWLVFFNSCYFDQLSMTFTVCSVAMPKFKTQTTTPHAGSCQTKSRWFLNHYFIFCNLNRLTVSLTV